MLRRGAGEADDAAAQVVEVGAELGRRADAIEVEQLHQVDAVRGGQEERRRRRAVQGRDEGEEHRQSGEPGQPGPGEAGVQEEQGGPGHRGSVLVSLIEVERCNFLVFV